jgi:hypothetical protein
MDKKCPTTEPMIPNRKIFKLALSAGSKGRKTPRLLSRVGGSMSLAFEFTSEDAYNVLRRMGHKKLGSEDPIVEEAFDALCAEDGCIEDAALYGDDLGEQTELAYLEMEKILRQEDRFLPVVAPPPA